MNEWQPMETAPRDGTKILVFTVHGDVEISQWFLYPIERFELYGDTGLYRRIEAMSEGAWNSNAPTHWMPLPEPPND